MFEVLVGTSCNKFDTVMVLEGWRNFVMDIIIDCFFFRRDVYDLCKLQRDDGITDEGGLVVELI